MTRDSAKKGKNSLKRRLVSLHARPVEGVRVTSVQLANDGFCYEEGTGHLICEDCGLQLEDFKDPVDSYALHLIHSPNCQFLSKSEEKSPRKNAKTDTSHRSSQSDDSENLSEHVTMSTTGLSVISEPNSSTTSNAEEGAASNDKLRQYNYLAKQRSNNCESMLSTSVSNLTDLNFERSRFATFINIPNIPGRSLAAAGMSYSCKRKQLLCTFCDFTCKLSTDEEWDLNQIIEDHRNAFPQCHILTGQNSGNVPDVLSETCWTVTGRLEDKTRDNQDGLQHLGINRKPAEYPDLAVSERRKATFLTYPHNNGKVDTDTLCAAGYFYEGNGTPATCFSCGLISDHWGSNEDPWKRQARSSSSCQFLIDQKGRDFITTTVEELGMYRKPKQENKVNNVTPRMLRPRWDSEVVQQALNMGMNRESVKTVISNRIKKGDPDFRYVADIYQAVEDLVVPEQQLSARPELQLPTVVQLPSDPVDGAIQSSEQSESTVEETEEEVRVTSDSPAAVMDTIESVLVATNSASNDQFPQVAEDPTKRAALAKTFSSRLTCSVCMSDIVAIIFLPCAHLVCCVDCAAAMVHCPICRHEIRATIKANFRQLG